MKHRVSLVSPFRVERLPDGRRQLAEDLRVSVDDVTYTVPKGFTTDYSSIPWLFRWLVRWDRVDIAGVLHDYLYRRRRQFEGEPVTRRFADRLWRLVAAAGVNGANPVQAFLGWAGLRAGGWWAWHFTCPKMEAV